MSQQIKEFTIDAKEFMVDEVGQPCLWYTNALWHDNDFPEQPPCNCGLKQPLLGL